MSTSICACLFVQLYDVEDFFPLEMPGAGKNVILLFLASSLVSYNRTVPFARSKAPRLYYYYLSPLFGRFFLTSICLGPGLVFVALDVLLGISARHYRCLSYLERILRTKRIKKYDWKPLEKFSETRSERCDEKLEIVRCFS